MEKRGVFQPGITPCAECGSPAGYICVSGDPLCQWCSPAYEMNKTAAELETARMKYGKEGVMARAAAAHTGSKVCKD